VRHGWNNHSIKSAGEFGSESVPAQTLIADSESKSRPFFYLRFLPPTIFYLESSDFLPRVLPTPFEFAELVTLNNIFAKFSLFLYFVIGGCSFRRTR
jgi:hypothetical protein